MGFSDSVFENKLLAKKIGCFDPTQYKMANKFANTKQKPTIMKSGEFANKRYQDLCQHGCFQLTPQTDPFTILRRKENQNWHKNAQHRTTT